MAEKSSGAPKPVKRIRTGSGKKSPPKPVKRVRTGNSSVKRRVRPSVRANARRAKAKARPMPKPPTRRKVVRRTTAATGAAATASPRSQEKNAELQAQIDGIDRKFDSLESEAQLTSIYDAIGRFDAKLTELPFELEALRDRGYVHSGQLEDRLEALDDKWDEVRPRVEEQLNEQVERLDKQLDQAEKLVDRMHINNEASIKSADTAVDSLERRVRAAHDAIDNLYEGIEQELSEIEYQLDRVEKMFEILDGSQDIQLREAEGPLLVVKAFWHRDGEKEGPEGYLFLTDQRLIFEQREEVVTKKKFGLFKADSEMVQEVHVDVEVHEIEEIEHKEEGGFMGMGKDDIIEFVFAASANYSRARFHLKGQDSSDWAAMIKRIQTGEIDEDRSDEYVDELEEAGIISSSFPTQCPNCFAAIPEQPRGVTSYTCEFCGAVVAPEIQE